MITYAPRSGHDRPQDDQLSHRGVFGTRRSTAPREEPGSSPCISAAGGDVGDDAGCRAGRLACHRPRLSRLRPNANPRFERALGNERVGRRCHRSARPARDYSGGCRRMLDGRIRAVRDVEERAALHQRGRARLDAPWRRQRRRTQEPPEDDRAGRSRGRRGDRGADGAESCLARRRSAIGPISSSTCAELIVENTPERVKAAIKAMMERERFDAALEQDRRAGARHSWRGRHADSAERGRGDAQSDSKLPARADTVVRPSAQPRTAVVFRREALAISEEVMKMTLHAFAAIALVMVTVNLRAQEYQAVARSRGASRAVRCAARSRTCATGSSTIERCRAIATA